MTRILVGALAGMFLLGGCETRTEKVNAERIDVAKESAKAEQTKAKEDAKATDKLAKVDEKDAQKKADIQNDMAKDESKLAKVDEKDAKEKADIVNDAAKEKAKADHKVYEQQKDVVAAQDDTRKSTNENRFKDANRPDQFHDLSGTGGSGAAASSVSVTGTVKSTFADNLKIIDSKGAELKLDTNSSTRVMRDGQAIKLDDIKAGCEVRAAYYYDGNQHMAEKIEVLHNSKPVDLK